MERSFKGIWISKEIWLSKELSLQEKVFLVEIDSLDNEKGCFASNAHFADFFSLSKNRCSEIIKSLEKKGLISIIYIKDEGKKNIKKRVIKVVDKSKGGTRKTEEGYSEKLEGSNTLSINTEVNKDIVEIVNYLNESTGKKYRHSTPSTRKIIKARRKDGFTVDDFKNVIDTKVAEWKNDKHMNQYLRPETLFGTKFESYLNQNTQSTGYDPTRDSF